MHPKLILIRGGGDLASGIALRLHRVGFGVVISELAHPLAVRRTVSFSEAVYLGIQTVEGITARRVDYDNIDHSLDTGEIAVIVDPHARILADEPGCWPVVIDARMLKRAPSPLPIPVPLLIGLGPGFQAGVNCNAVVETRRGHTLGRLLWQGAPLPDSGLPEGNPRRVLRAPRAGEVYARAMIGDHIESGQIVAEIRTENRSPEMVTAKISGVLRGMIHDGIIVPENAKIGDVDPRDDASACFLVSDKALAVAGGVLEAVFSSGMPGIDSREIFPRSPRG